ncbi:MAG: hypothetical protein ACT4P2_14600, partial [Pseudomonadota bacterium]
MFLRATIRKKDGKEHRYFSVVENRRVGGGRVVQRHVLYLGEINSSQELAWRKSIEVLEEGAESRSICRRTAPGSAIGSTAGSCGRRGGARGGISCAAISPRTTP